MALTRGERLRKLREDRDVEQKEAAVAIGISRGWLSLLERDQKGKNLDHTKATLERIAAYYGVMPEYLIAETPQEYALAVAQANRSNPDLTTVGRRLRFVVEDLHRRWGDEFSPGQIADRAGIPPARLAEYMDDRTPLIEKRDVSGLLEVTGIPYEFLWPTSADPTDEDEEFWRVIRSAQRLGITAAEFEYFVQMWSVARAKTDKPPKP